VELVYYRASALKHHGALRAFRKFFTLYGVGVAPVDRSGTLAFPIKTKSLFPLPHPRCFALSYADVCHLRARELHKRAGRLDVPLYVFWSGGVDSTCLLVALIAHANASERDRIVVLLSEASIGEYPAFYRQHIRGQLKCAPAALGAHLLGGKNLIVNGEHNDQLFGSDIIAAVIDRFGFERLAQRYDRNLFGAFFAEKLKGDYAGAKHFVKLFERLKAAAPLELVSNYDLLWWINFALKWQTVYARMLAWTGNAKLDNTYLETYYAPFYNTENFQLWSMNNLDRRIKDNWGSYKWPAKELIYEFTKDADYRDNKRKRNSLACLTARRAPVACIDANWTTHETIDIEQVYAAENDFA